MPSLPVPGVDVVLGGALESIEIKTVLDNVLERVYGEFDDLLEQGPSLSDEERYRNMHSSIACPS